MRRTKSGLTMYSGCCYYGRDLEPGDIVRYECDDWKVSKIGAMVNLKHASGKTNKAALDELITVRTLASEAT